MSVHSAAFRLVLARAVALAALSFPYSASGCKCVEDAGLGALSDRAEAVAFGRVVALSDIADGQIPKLLSLADQGLEPELGRDYGVRVSLAKGSLILKGEQGTLERIATGYDGSSCQSDLQVGKSYILFLNAQGVVLSCGGVFEFEVLTCANVHWFQVFSRRVSGEAVQFTMPHQPDEPDEAVLAALKVG